jgi:hypothetical protein
MAAPRSPSKTAKTAKKLDVARKAADVAATDIVAAMPNGAAFAAAYMQGLSRVGEEAARFATRRMEHNVATAQALAGCASPVDAWSVWSEAAQSLARDYVEEATRMGEVYAEAAAAAQNELAAPAPNGKADDEGAS